MKTGRSDEHTAVRSQRKARLLHFRIEMDRDGHRRAGRAAVGSGAGVPGSGNRPFGRVHLHVM